MSTRPIAPRPHGAPVVVPVLAAAAQAGVLLLTLMFGLGWGGWTWAAALLQVLALSGVLAVLASRRSWLVVAVPIASLLLSLGLFVLFVQAETRWACKPEYAAATSQLDPPAGSDVRFTGEAGNGCIARFTTDATPQEILAHYRGELTENGWNITSQQATEIVAVKDGIIMTVSVSPQEGGLVIMRIDAA